MLAGGPIDTRVSPTVVNTLAVERGTEWFRSNVITTVPWPSPGFTRPVYPGFLQLTGFMTMNLDRHVRAHKDLFNHLVIGDGDSAEKHREFYDEYLAVMDLTAEFYMQTIESVFVRHALPKGEMIYRGRRVDLGAIRRVGLMTVEGEKDDITGAGQCAAAIDLCHSIPADRKVHFECPGVGHYGIFNGSRFRSEIAPRIARFVRQFDPRSAAQAGKNRESWLQKVRSAAHVGEFEASAFAFAAANDTAPDRAASRLRAAGIGEMREAASSTSSTSVAMLAAPFKLWSMTANLFIDGMLRLGSPNTGDPVSKVRERS